MVDFQGLAEQILSNASVLVPSWLPGGKLEGAEYKCANLMGGKGTSLSVNVQTGKWADFATDDKGGDLISLYAAINNLTQIEAAKSLGAPETEAKIPEKQKIKPNTPKLVPPPKGTKLPAGIKTAHYKWYYRDLTGKVLFAVTRHDRQDGSKTFCPWSFTENGDWVKRAWPAPRPLYGLESLQKNPSKPVMIVEGEKAADAARKIVGDKYLVLTWSSGSKAYSKADWKPIHGRNLLVWPDADKPGVDAAESIVRILYNHCPGIKVLSTQDLPKNWDAADALEDGMTWQSFTKWAKPRAHVWKPPPETEQPVLFAQHSNNTDDGYGEHESQYNQEHEAIRNALIEAAEENLPHSATPSQFALWHELGVKVSKSGMPINNIDNTLLIFNKYKGMKADIWWDDFHQKVFYQDKNGKPREFNDTDYVRLLYFMQSEVGFLRMTKPIVSDAVELYARENTRNEPRDWMESLEWDQTSRLDDFFVKYMGVEDTDYTRAISRNFWLSMVARIYRPGCKADNMVILEGKQGAFKSTALSIIGGSWYAETNENPSSKDFFQVLQGKLIIEIAELDSFNKAERNTIKKVVSSCQDRYRPPYGRLPQDFPRQCVFVGTTNDNHYLNDPTGARRFWPVTIKKIDIKELKKDREQLFAEAVHLYKEGYTWHEVPKALAEEEQEKRRNSDIWEPAIDSWLKENTDFRLKGYTTVQEVAKQACGVELERQDIRISNRIGSILRSFGMLSKTKRIEGYTRPVRIYFNVEREEQITPKIKEDFLQPKSPVNTKHSLFD